MMDSYKTQEGRDSPQRSGDERSESARSGGESRRSSTSGSSEVAASPRRRRFTNAYKLQILRDAGALLEAEPRKRGHRAALANPLQAEVDRLRRANERLEVRLGQAHAIIDLQKKVAALFATLPPDGGRDGA